MKHRTRELVRFVSGNVVGIITERTPANRRIKPTSWVRIGVMDVARAQREPFPDADYKQVVEELMCFLTAGRVTTVAWDSSSTLRERILRSVTEAGHVKGPRPASGF